MTSFHDGPAAGLVLELARAPLFLRVVCVQADDGPQWDALDQLGDRPEAGATVHAYRKVADRGTIHIDGRDKRGRRFGKWLAFASYAIVAEQPAPDVLSSTPLWREWCVAERGKSVIGVQRCTHRP